MTVLIHEEEEAMLVADDAEIQKRFLETLSVTPEEVEHMVSAAQRYPDGRAHPDWIAARKNRLTASRFAGACDVSGATKSQSQVFEEMMHLPEANSNASKRFGIRYEDTAREAYIRKRRRDMLAVLESGCEEDEEEIGRVANGGKGLRKRPVVVATSRQPVVLQVREVGFCVIPEEPWLGASPDGVCLEDGIPAGLLEIKTGRCWGDHFERLHVDWVYQIQGSMRVASAALGAVLSWCDVFLWTPERSRCQRVEFDEGLWQQIMYPSLRSFYFETFLPVMVLKEKNRLRQGERMRNKFRAKREKKRKANSALL
eukprot:TRINITY_DN74989_c0_g1_i1.p1 TRINITY_DN74989_c0_g1~~TRINITY_DN74989_c0_g1_i1.p1  ORF type:complete len:313 (+),score=52.27 TRINITY_DN74989_c0_g1_i1:115-1053(+)